MLGEPGFGFKIAMVWALSLTISFTSEVWKSMHFHFLQHFITKSFQAIKK